MFRFQRQIYDRLEKFFYLCKRHHAAVVLLRDVESLHLLVHPGLLPGVALHDGEHDHVQGGVGAVQYLPPHIHTQKSHLFIYVLQ